MPPRFRPALQLLEARETPTVNVLYNGASLTLTGTPDTAPGHILTVNNTGGNNFAVTDGGVSLGTYHVTRNLSLRLDKFDTFVGVDLNGATLRGSVLVDLGAGDVTPDTFSLAFVTSSAAGAKVGGDVTFKGGAGNERVGLALDGVGSKLEVGGSVRATGPAVTTPVEDELWVGYGVTVDGNVTDTGYTYTTIHGAVDGDVTANAAGKPGGMGFTVDGTVHGDVAATGAATAAGYYSFANIAGPVDGDVRFNLTGGRATATVSGTVGGDWTVRHTGGGLVALKVVGTGEVKGDLSVATADDTATDQTVVYLNGIVDGDFRYKETGNAGSTVVAIAGGDVYGDANIDLGGPDVRSSTVNLAGEVGGSATVIGMGKVVNVEVQGFTPYDPGLAAVTGDLRVRLGNGTNTLSVQQEDPSAATIGGRLSYTGGTGADVVTISGKFTFRAKIDLGGGDGSVHFAPDAVVGSLDLDYGKGPGVKTWTPPDLITFPTKIKNLN